MIRMLLKRIKKRGISTRYAFFNKGGFLMLRFEKYQGTGNDFVIFEMSELDRFATFSTSTKGL